MIDYTKIKKKLLPADDGQDVARIRTAVVNLVNADGTLDIILDGVVIAEVPKLGSAVVNQGQQVQVASWRGSLLVLGGLGQDAGATGQQPFVRADSLTSSGSIGSTETVVLTTTAKVFKAGRAYEVWVGGGVTYSANSAFSSWNIRKGTTVGGAQVLSFPRHSGGAATGTNEMHLNLRSIFGVGASDVTTTSLVLTLAVNGANTATHTGSSVNPRHFTILPAGFASAWGNIPILS